MNQDDLKDNLLDSNQWLRIVFMLCFAFAAWVVTFLLGVLVLVQLVVTLVSGSPNRNLQLTGYQLVRYLEQILQYLLYNTDEKPFPIADFPSAAGFEPPVYVRKPKPEAAAPEPGAATTPTSPEPLVQPQPEPPQAGGVDLADGPDGEDKGPEKLP